MATFVQGFKNLHQRRRPRVRIEAFSERVDPKSLPIQYADKKGRYTPVGFRVQVGVRPQDRGSVLVFKLPVAHNEGWYDELKQRVAQTMNVDAKNMELRTTDMQEVGALPEKSVYALGNLCVYVNGERVCSTTPVSMPIEFSSLKEASLAQWYAEMTHDVPSIVANAMHALGVDGIGQALEAGGTVDQVICAHVERSVPDWPEFQRVHHMYPPASANSIDVDANTRAVVAPLTNAVRNAIVANANQIRAYVAVANATTSDPLARTTWDAAIDKKRVIANPPARGLEMYSRMVSTALDTAPGLRLAVTNGVLNGQVIRSAPAPRPAHEERDAQTFQRLVDRIPASIAPHHPRYARLHALAAETKVYPRDYLAMHARRDMTPTAPYPGNIAAVYAAYHLFSGVPQMPKGISCSEWKKRRASRKTKGEEDEEEGSVTVKSTLPLMPIAAAETKMRAPPVIRMSVSLGDPAQRINDNMRSRVVPIAAGSDIVVEDDDDDTDLVSSRIKDEFAHLPKIEDFL